MTVILPSSAMQKALRMGTKTWHWCPVTHELMLRWCDSKPCMSRPVFQTLLTLILLLKVLTRNRKAVCQQVYK
jgi:hypothetical protein